MSCHSVASGLLLSLATIALVGCSGGQPKGIESTKSAAPLPPLNAQDLAATDITAPAAGTTTTVTTQTTEATPPLAIPPIQSPSSMEMRMSKLEEAVGSLRTDYDRIMPAIASLNTTNERIQTLLNQIENEHGALPSAGPAVVSKASPPVPASKAPATISPVTMPAGAVSRHTPVMSTPPMGKAVTAADVPATVKTTGDVVPSDDVMKAMEGAASGAAPIPATGAVKGIRIGEHGSKTRLVIDLAGTAKPEVVYDLDNTEKLLLVELPESVWGGAKSGTPKASAYIASWTAQGEAQGSSLAIQLKKDAKIVSTEYLKAEGKDPARLVIDLGPAT